MSIETYDVPVTEFPPRIVHGWQPSHRTAPVLWPGLNPDLTGPERPYRSPGDWARDLGTAAAPGFGTVLRDIRETAHISQSRLAAWAGITHSAVFRLETGARQPRRETVDRIIGALGLDVATAATLRAAAGFVSPEEAPRWAAD